MTLLWRKLLLKRAGDSSNVPKARLQYVLYLSCADVRRVMVRHLHLAVYDVLPIALAIEYFTRSIQGPFYDINLQSSGDKPVSLTSGWVLHGHSVCVKTLTSCMLYWPDLTQQCFSTQTCSVRANVGSPHGSSLLLCAFVFPPKKTALLLHEALMRHWCKSAAAGPIWLAKK